ncbi:Uncharacterised protein [Sphingobacterium thalpophilum]|uniref:Uncharacterized protein n=1 Tax=Sphingobacterium thalpophilum TaxID=259 RepID=A0A4U9V7G6_9SPHI|nr:Uncharacterised protein [Sphingobacterium thalpophilum]
MYEIILNENPYLICYFFGGFSVGDRFFKC